METATRAPTLWLRTPAGDRSNSSFGGCCKGEGLNIITFCYPPAGADEVSAPASSERLAWLSAALAWPYASPGHGIAEWEMPEKPLKCGYVSETLNCGYFSAGKKRLRDT